MHRQLAEHSSFLLLPKTHKKVLKIRPIVSDRGGIFESLCWFLQCILRPLLAHVSAHITNTEQLIDRFNTPGREKLKDMIPISFEVVSLYTNINTEEAINTALHYTVKHKLELHGLETSHIAQLLHLLWDNNVFEYPGSGFFHQIGGLAMGSKWSGTLAILVIDRFENDHIYQNILFSPRLYVRYIDDTGTLAKNTEHAEYMFEYLNRWHPMTKFDLETPDESGFLPILNTKMKIQEDGTLSTKNVYKDSQQRSYTTPPVASPYINKTSYCEE